MTHDQLDRFARGFITTRKIMEDQGITDVNWIDFEEHLKLLEKMPVEHPKAFRIMKLSLCSNLTDVALSYHRVFSSPYLSEVLLKNRDNYMRWNSFAVVEVQKQYNKKFQVSTNAFTDRLKVLNFCSPEIFTQLPASCEIRRSESDSGNLIAMNCSSTIFVANFPANWSVLTLKKVFGKYGKIEIVKRDQKNGTALVSFKEEDSAVEVIRKLDGCRDQKSEKVLHLCMYQKDRTSAEESTAMASHKRLYVTSIAREIDQKSLHKLFAQYGNLVRVFMLSGVSPEGQRAIVEYHNHCSAALAIKKIRSAKIPSSKEGSYMAIFFARNRTRPRSPQDDTFESIYSPVFMEHLQKESGALFNGNIDRALGPNDVRMQPDLYRNLLNLTDFDST